MNTFQRNSCKFLTIFTSLVAGIIAVFFVFYSLNALFFGAVSKKKKLFQLKFYFEHEITTDNVHFSFKQLLGNIHKKATLPLKTGHNY